tara:strand:+ start:5675 stop:6664 length:990 start_codon:yes stop_codon:yes gene_type:complete
MKHNVLKRHLISLVGVAGLTALYPAPALATVADGVYAYQVGDYSRAHAEWLPYAALGNENALYNLGQLYRMGRGVERNYAKAESYYLRAAESGHVGAQRNLGTLYYFGRIGAVDHEKAFSWLIKAAKNGDPKSQLMVGTMYYNGEAVERDPVKAHAWISLAAGRGLGDAESALQTLNGAMTSDQINQSQDIAPTLTALHLSPDDVGLMVQPPTETETPKPLIPTQTTAAPETKQDIAPTEPDGADLYRVQVGSYTSEQAAEKARADLANRQADILQGVTSKITYADIAEKGVFYRLQLAPFRDRTSAGQLCQQLKDAGQGCYVVKTPQD